MGYMPSMQPQITLQLALTQPLDPSSLTCKVGLSPPSRDESMGKGLTGRRGAYNSGLCTVATSLDSQGKTWELEIPQPLFREWKFVTKVILCS